MALLELLRLGHPALRTAAEAVPPEQIGTTALQELFDAMAETMDAADGVGLAAPQIGDLRQIFVFKSDAGAARVVVNPLLTLEPGELVYDWEGCLSIPGLRGLVPRHPVVRLQGLDHEGKALDETFEGFEARILQHENDHLNGIVFLDRMRDLRSLCFTEEWEQLLRDMGIGAPAAVG